MLDTIIQYYKYDNTEHNSKNKVNHNSNISVITNCKTFLNFQKYIQIPIKYTY